MIEHNSEVYNHPYISFFTVHVYIWKKISVGVIVYFTVMFDHPSCFLTFCRSGIPTSCYIFNVFYYFYFSCMNTLSHSSRSPLHTPSHSSHPHTHTHTHTLTDTITVHTELMIFPGTRTPSPPSLITRASQSPSLSTTSKE